MTPFGHLLQRQCPWSWLTQASSSSLFEGWGEVTMPYILVTVPFISSEDLKQAFSGYLNKSSQLYGAVVHP